MFNILYYPPSEILEKSAKKISEGKCETYDVDNEALNEINEIAKNSRNNKKKENEKTIMELRKQLSSIVSQLEKYEK